VNDSTKVAAFVANTTLGEGLHSKTEPCTIAAINLVLRHLFTDACPECMSPELCDFVITLQDSISESTRNSAEWKSIVPLLLNTKDQNAEIKNRIQELGTKLLLTVGYKLTVAADIASDNDWHYVALKSYQKLNITKSRKMRAFWDSHNPSVLVRRVLGLEPI
jgi:hypothetical protein